MVCLEIAVRMRCVEVHGKMMLMGLKPVPVKVFKFDLIFTFYLIWRVGKVRFLLICIYAKMQINSVSSMKANS